jgi:hypothetical protein
MGDRDMVATLVSHGANVWQQDGSGTTAEMAARRAGFTVIVSDLQAAAKAQIRRLNAGLAALGYLTRVEDAWSEKNREAFDKFRSDFPQVAASGNPEQALRRALASTARVCNATTQQANLVVGNTKSLRGWIPLEAGRCRWITRASSPEDLPESILVYASIGPHERPTKEWGGTVTACIPKSQESIEIANPVYDHDCPTEMRSLRLRPIMKGQMLESVELD